MQWIEGPVATAARSLGGYGRDSRKYSYSFVTIRQLLTRCGARMPLTNVRRQSRAVAPQRAMARSAGAPLVSALENGLHCRC